MSTSSSPRGLDDHGRREATEGRIQVHGQRELRTHTRVFHLDYRFVAGNPVAGGHGSCEQLSAGQAEVFGHTLPVKA